LSRTDLGFIEIKHLRWLDSHSLSTDSSHFLTPSQAWIEISTKTGRFDFFCWFDLNKLTSLIYLFFENLENFEKKQNPEKPSDKPEKQSVYHFSFKI
jgi:hypothetical protein